MKSKDTRTFLIDGKEMRFNFDSFNSLIHDYKKRNKMTVAEIEESIANKANVTNSAVHNWRQKLNGSGDIEIIEKIASALNEANWRILLIEITKGHTNMNKFSERELNAIKKIYDSIIDFLDEFQNTTGFNDLWFKYSEKGYKNPENGIYEYVEEKLNYIYLIYKREHFDLKNLDIYDELGNYIDEDLIETYNCKLSYGYRFEADEITTPTTNQDYEIAMNKLNQIIDKYI